MKFSKWPYWVRGAFLALIIDGIYLIILELCTFAPGYSDLACFSVTTLLGPQLWISWYVSHVLYSVAENITFPAEYTFYLISLIASFILGSLIGCLVKYRKNKKSPPK
jgi:uncharacterized membrane protein